MGLRMRRTIIVTILSVTLVLGGLVAGEIVQATSSERAKARTEQISLLFVQSAPAGSFARVEGSTDRFILTLRDPAPEVVWFSNRPARHQGRLPLEGYVGAWRGFGFGSDPPNAALTLLHGDRAADTVVLSLGSPRHDESRGTIRYPAHLLPRATGNLSDFESQRDRRIPQRFGDASLFVDDGSAPVVNGCVIQPYSDCEGDDLSNADLAGVYWPNANLQNANLNGANLSGANLSNGANFIATDFSNANLTNADFSDGFLFGTNFYFANLDGANFAGANLYGCNRNMPQGGGGLGGLGQGGGGSQSSPGCAVFCSTTMPDGSTDNSDCQQPCMPNCGGAPSGPGRIAAPPWWGAHRPPSLSPELRTHWW